MGCKVEVVSEVEGCGAVEVGGLVAVDDIEGTEIGGVVHSAGAGEFDGLGGETVGILLSVHANALPLHKANNSCSSFTIRSSAVADILLT